MISVLALLVAYRTGAATAGGPQPATRIEADDKAGVIRFIVNGKEQARIGMAGLRVRGDVAYGGVETDLGSPQEYDRAAP